MEFPFYYAEPGKLISESECYEDTEALGVICKRASREWLEKASEEFTAADTWMVFWTRPNEDFKEQHLRSRQQTYRTPGFENASLLEKGLSQSL